MVELQNTIQEENLQMISSQSVTISWPTTMEFIQVKTGKKRKQVQEKETEEIKKAKETSSRKSKENMPVSESKTEWHPGELVQDDEVDL